MKLRTINQFAGWLSLLLAAIYSPTGFGGTGAGNEFEHLVNYEFDFHVAKPKDWYCNDCESIQKFDDSSESTIEWHIKAPEGTTWLNVSFITGFPATKETELRTEIEQRHPDWEWFNVARADGSFVGFTNSVQGDAANAATEYYLVKKNMVIKLEWQKDANLPDSALKLDLIKASIDRVSSPLRIKSIKSESEADVRPGERACWLVEVDDLRSAFDKSSIREFEVKGAPSHFSFKSIDWIGEKNWFRICQIVPNSAGPDGLMITRLRVSDEMREVSCEASSTKMEDLTCRLWGETDLSEADQYAVAQSIGKVDNAHPDTKSPHVNAINFNRQKLQVVLDATDDTQLFMAEIQTRAGSVIVYPDQLRTGTGVDLSQLSYPGWNSILRVTIYDRNGLPTVLEAPKDLKKQKADTPLYYNVVEWGGNRYQSNIPVVAWLQERRVGQ